MCTEGCRYYIDLKYGILVKGLISAAVVIIVAEKKPDNDD